MFSNMKRENMFDRLYVKYKNIRYSIQYILMFSLYQSCIYVCWEDNNIDMRFPYRNIYILYCHYRVVVGFPIGLNSYKDIIRC